MPSPTVYDPSKLIVRINGEIFLQLDSVEASPIEAEEWSTVRSTTGPRGWVRTPEYGAEISITFSNNLSASKRQSLRQMKGQEVTITVVDKSGTKDGVTGHNARMVSEPDLSRDDSEATLEATWQAPTASWG